MWLDSFGDRVAEALWGDEVFDGEDDGLIGSVIWALRSAADPDDDPADDMFVERIAESVWSGVRAVRRAF